MHAWGGWHNLQWWKGNVGVLTPCETVAGLTAALELLKEVTDKREGVSYADVFQLASATAIELAGGPKIPLRFGRRDARNEEDCCPEGRLPGAWLFSMIGALQLL